jgi:DNA adenine methylase
MLDIMPKTQRKTHSKTNISRKVREPVKPPFCRQGNKFPIHQQIVWLIPPHTTYVEPFLGSGAIFFNKEPASKSVLNDLDKRTVERFELLRKAPLDHRKYRHDLNTVSKIRAFYLHHSRSVADRLFYEKIVACNGFSGKPVSGPQNIYRKADPAKMLDLLEEYQTQLRNAVLTNVDYAECIRTHDTPTAFFFLDPPYENTVATYGYAEHADFDFERFAQVVAGIKGKWLITIDDSPRIRSIFSDYYQKKVKVYTKWGHTSGNRSRKELFIANYRI